MAREWCGKERVMSSEDRREEESSLQMLTSSILAVTAAFGVYFCSVWVP